MVPTPGRLRWEDPEFQTNQGHLVRLSQKDKNKNKLKLACVALGNKIFWVGHNANCHSLFHVPSISPERREACVSYGRPRKSTACTRKGQSMKQRETEMAVAAGILAGSHLSWPPLNEDTVKYRKLRPFIPMLMSCLCTGKPGTFRHQKVL